MTQKYTDMMHGPKPLLCNKTYPNRKGQTLSTRTISTIVKEWRLKSEMKSRRSKKKNFED